MNQPRKYSMTKTHLAFAIVICLCHSTMAADVRKVTMDNSQIHSLTSSETGKEYDIITGTPWSYQGEPGKKYPVIYMLDGQWDFTKLNSMYGALYYDKAIPEFIIVGISYGGKDPDYSALRAHDYTPVQPKDGKMKMGGAPKFLTFIEKELVPFVESNYRVDSSFKVLAGASFGGLFSIYTLLTKPDLFQAHIAISPSVGWENKYAFTLEKSFNKKNDKLVNTLWLSVGGAEKKAHITATQDFAQQIKASNYKGLHTSFRIIEGFGHAGNGIVAYARSVIDVFKPLLPVEEK